MKKILALFCVGLLVSLVGCAPMAQQGGGYNQGQGRYNTQKGALGGAAIGAIAGQAIGRNTEGTLIGAAVGTALGALVGNAADQSHDAAREQHQVYQPTVMPLSPREEAYQREMLRLQSNAEIEAARKAERARREALRIQEAQGRQQAQEDFRQSYGGN